MVCGVALPPTRGGLRTRRSILFRYTLLLSRGQVAVFALVLIVAALPLASGFAFGSVRIVSGCGIGGAPAHPDPRPELAAESEHDRFRVLHPVPTPFVRALPVFRASLQGPALTGPPRIRSYDRNLRQKTTAIIAGSCPRFRRQPRQIPADRAITEKRFAAPASPGPVSQRFRADCAVGGQPVQAQRGVIWVRFAPIRADRGHMRPRSRRGPSAARLELAVRHGGDRGRPLRPVSTQPLATPATSASREKETRSRPDRGRFPDRFKRFPLSERGPVRRKTVAKPAHGTPKPANGPPTTRQNPLPHSNPARACCQCSRPLR